MIISVHIPKTAGTSFARTLQDIYKEKLFLDYNDIHMTSAKQFFLARLKDRITNKRKKILEAKIECIHGHFIPMKYRFYFPKAKYIIWLREPIQRLISFYNFLKKIDHQEIEKHQKELFKRNNKLNIDVGQNVSNILKKQKHLEKITEDDILNFIINNKKSSNHYKKWLRGFNLNNFFFIGITEEYEKSMKLFYKMINCKNELLTYQENIGSYNHKVLQEIDPNIYRILEKQNAFDIDLYKQAKQQFTLLCQQYNI